MKPDTTTIVPVEIEGAKILVEATYSSLSRIATQGEETESPVSGEILSFEEVTNTIKAVATGLEKTLTSVKPSKATIEFGVELKYEPGRLLAVIMQGSSTVNLKITLEWEKKST